MKRKTFKNSILSMLSLCLFLLLSTQAVYAAKPVKAPATPTIVIHSVIVDTGSNTIDITGAKLNTISEVTLAGLTVNFTSSNESTGTITFIDIAAVIAELTAGNYALVLGDATFSIYLSALDAAAITPPDPVVYADCPCYTEWELFGTNYNDPFTGSPYFGFENEKAYTCVNTAEQTNVNIITSQLENWTLDTQFNSTSSTGTCSTPDPTFTFSMDLSSQVQHDACAGYLQTTYCN